MSWIWLTRSCEWAKCYKSYKTSKQSTWPKGIQAFDPIDFRQGINLTNSSQGYKTYFLHNYTRNHHNYLYQQALLPDFHSTQLTRDKNMPEQWTKLEDLRYHFFLILHIRRLYPSHKKSDTLFKEMEGFLRSKESRQCRSHHQKRGDVKDILAYLRGFYHENYEIRLLDVEHIQAEFRHYLTKVNTNFLQQIQPVNGSEVSIQDVIAIFRENLKFILAGKYQPVLSKDQSTQTDFREDKQTQTDGFDEVRKALEEIFQYEISQDNTEIHLTIQSRDTSFQ